MIPNMEIVNQKNDLVNLRDLKKYENKILILNNYWNQSLIKDTASIMQLLDATREFGIIVIIPNGVVNRFDISYKFKFRIHTTKLSNWLKHEIFVNINSFNNQNRLIIHESIYQVYFDRQRYNKTNESNE